MLVERCSAGDQTCQTSGALLLFDRIVRTILEPSAGKSGGATLSATKNEQPAHARRPARPNDGVLDRSIDPVARPACAITEVCQVRATDSVASSSSFLPAVHVCGSGSTLGRCLHRRSTATAIDCNDKTEQHVLRRRPRDRHAHGPHEVDPPKRYVSRHIAVLDGLGYFVFLLMRRSSSCRQRLAVAAPAAIAHPKRDVNIRLRSFDEKSPSSSRCDSTCCSGWTGRM